MWPPPPEPARIQFVGQLATSDDLKPGKSFGQGLGEMVFGRGPARSMLTPYAVCTDGAEGQPSNRLFVADSNAQVVHVFDFKTRRYDAWAPPAATKGADRRFSQPVGVAYNSSGDGRLYVADSVAGRLYVFDGAGKYQGEAGVGALARPCGLAFDARAGRLFVADAAAHQVVVFSSDGEVLARIGERGTALGQFNYPTNVAVDSRGRLYVSDSLNFRVQQFGPDLKPIRQIGRKGDSPGSFGQPKGIAVDSQDHLYVVDANFELVQIFDDEGRVLLDFGREGQGPGNFWLPAGIFIDGKDRIWVADCYNRRVEVFDYLALPTAPPDDSPTAVPTQGPGGRSAVTPLEVLPRSSPPPTTRPASPPAIRPTERPATLPAVGTPAIGPTTLVAPPRPAVPPAVRPATRPATNPGKERQP